MCVCVCVYVDVPSVRDIVEEGVVVLVAAVCAVEALLLLHDEERESLSLLCVCDRGGRGLEQPGGEGACVCVCAYRKMRTRQKEKEIHMRTC